MPSQKLTTKEILHQNLLRTAPDRIRNLKLVLHNIRSMHNVGAAFRCADAFGVGELILSGFTPVPPRPEISKTAIGAEDLVPWNQINSFHNYCHRLKEKDYLFIGLEQTSDSIDFPEFQPPPRKNICLVFGNEVTGLDDDILPLIDTFVEIPQYGHKHSLNVSVTVGIALYALLQKFW